MNSNSGFNEIIVLLNATGDLLARGLTPLQVRQLLERNCPANADIEAFALARVGNAPVQVDIAQHVGLCARCTDRARAALTAATTESADALFLEPDCRVDHLLDILEGTDSPSAAERAHLLACAPCRWTARDILLGARDQATRKAG